MTPEVGASIPARAKKFGAANISPLRLRYSEPMKDWRFALPVFLPTVLLFLVTVLRFLLTYTNLLTVWCGILLWEAFTRQKLPIEIKWSLYFGAFAVVSFWNWRKEFFRACDAEAALKAEKSKPSPARIFVENTDALLERYGQSGALAEKLLPLGNWLQVSGSFEGAADSLVGDATFVSIILESGRRVQLRFPNNASDSLRLLRKGQQITAVCQIQHGHGLGVFILDNCELIAAKPLRPSLARAA